MRIKFLSKVAPAAEFARHVPPDYPHEIIFDVHARQYDALVVYDDLPKEHSREELACPPEMTLHIATEPSAIKCYGPDFLAQFGTLVSSREAWATRGHPNVIHSQPGLRWFYGVANDGSHMLTYAELAALPAPSKTKSFSTVCSNKRMGHTLHKRRYDFTQAVKAELPELEIFGHGVRAVNDKAEALDTFKYHLAIENHLAPHHFTEKLTDSFLGFCLPFYVGAPNAGDYFPPESFIPLNIFEPEAAIETMRKAMNDGEYEKRLPAILEARRLVLEKYNLFHVIDTSFRRKPESMPDVGAGLIMDSGFRRNEGNEGSVIVSRHLARAHSPLTQARYWTSWAEGRVRNAY
jgi:hypothetical protein